jgi:hypothetical protein
MADMTWSIEPLSLFTAIVHPAVTDVLGPGENAYDGVMQDFIVMDDVPYKRPIIDITKLSNTLRRRSATCDMIYKQVGNTALRYIETNQLIAATKQCDHEFYQGALQDFAAKRMETFNNKIIPFFLASNRTDIATNAWFGDVNRASTTMFSTNAFDGIIKWIAYYVNAGTIASAQTFTIPTVDFYDPAHYGDAYNAIVAAYQKQTDLMKALPTLDRVIYCDTATLVGYRGYLRSLGNPISVDTVAAFWGSKLEQFTSYNGIPIIDVPIWNLALNDILGTGQYNHQVILTVRNNFIFATDKSYGGGPNFDTGLLIWYRYIDMSMYYQQFLKGGTQISLPEFIVYGSNA